MARSHYKAAKRQKELAKKKKKEEKQQRRLERKNSPSGDMGGPHSREDSSDGPEEK